MLTLMVWSAMCLVLGTSVALLVTLREWRDRLDVLIERTEHVLVAVDSPSTEDMTEVLAEIRNVDQALRFPSRPIPERSEWDGNDPETWWAE